MSFSLVVGKRFLVVGTFSTNALKSQCQNHHHGSYWATRMFMSSTTSLAATAPRGLRPPPPAAAVTSFLGTTFHNKNAFPSSSSSSLLLLPTPINHALLIMRGKNTLKTNRSIAKRLRPRGNRTLKRNKSGKSHNTGYKTRARTNRLGQSTTIKERKMEKKMQRCLGLR